MSYLQAKGIILNKKAFTLIEIMVVVMTLSVLLSFFAIEIARFWADSKKDLAKSQVYNLRKMINQFYSDFGRYPSDLKEMIELGYLKNIPVNPLNNKISWEVRPIDPGDTLINQSRDIEDDLNWYDVREDGTMAGWPAGNVVFDIRIPLELDPGSDPANDGDPDAPDPIDNRWRTIPKE